MDMPAENKEAVKVQVGECKEIIDSQKPPEPPPPDTTMPGPTPGNPGGGTPPGPEGRKWWKDPVGGALVGAGVVGVGLGVVFLVQGHSADQDKLAAMNYDDYQTLDDRAKSKGQLGVIMLVAGGALAAGGVAWYATHKPSHNATVTGWLDGDSGGFVVRGGF